MGKQLRRGLAVALVVGFLFAMHPAVAHAQSESNGEDSGDSSLIDVIVGALKGFVQVVADAFNEVIDQINNAIGTLVDTPYPDSIFDRPTNGPWPGIYDFYWQTMVPLSLLVWVLSVGIVILLEAMGHLFSGYHRAKLKRRSFIGLLGVLSWWWLAALSLRFMSGLTEVIMPTIGDSLFEVVSATAMGVILYLVMTAIEFSLVLLLGLIYLGRHFVLYGFVLLMPLLIAMWVPGLGPFRPVAGLSAKLGKFYVPFLIMTIPAAILFRVGELLGHSFGADLPSLFAWIGGLLVPFLAVLAPLVLFWQAGLLFVIGSRVSRHMSAERAANRTRKHVEVTRQGGRNTVRGLRDNAPVRADGQILLDGGESRAYRAGRELRRTGVRTGAAVRTTGERLQTTVGEFRDRLRERRRQAGRTDAGTRTPRRIDTERSRRTDRGGWSDRGDWNDRPRSSGSPDRNTWAAGDEGPQWSDRGGWGRSSQSSGGWNSWSRSGSRGDGDGPTGGGGTTGSGSSGGGSSGGGSGGGGGGGGGGAG